MPHPNFFIVGAPKCGTTSLYHWLRERPDVFLPFAHDRYWRFKEPYRFCPDLVAPPHRVEADEYERMFDQAGDAPHRGDASAIHLLSDEAAGRIRNYAPDARIIICLRHPAEFLVAWWRDCLYWGHDDEIDFERAIDPARDARALPARCWYPKAVDYRRAARLSLHVRRFLDAFPASQVHFV
ncbi:MAG: hypothetical protein GC152_01315 [Alphaproteobacteria bacterium]|nr:hypothetical protein [Alphaproteobacteria bacterium]